MSIVSKITSGFGIIVLKGQGVFSHFDARRLGLFIYLFIHVRHGRCKYQNEQLLVFKGGKLGKSFSFSVWRAEDMT